MSLANILEKQQPSTRCKFYNPIEQLKKVKKSKMGRIAFTIFLFVYCALFILPLRAIEEHANLFNVSPRMELEQIEPGSHSSDLNAVNGLRSCGGPGRVVQWRFEPCNGEVPCRIPGDGKKRRSELEFIPSKDIFMLGLRFNVVGEGQATHTVFDRPIQNSVVKGGKTYIHRISGGPPKDMAGKNFTYQYVLYRVGDGKSETCAEADFEVMNP